MYKRQGLGVVGVAAFLTLIIIVIGGLLAGLRTPYGRLTGIPAEGAALVTLILVQGVISDGFAGPVGWEVGVLMLSVLISDLGRQWRRHPSPTIEEASAAQDRGFAEPAREDGLGSPGIAPDGRININEATIQELTLLPGVGRRIGSRIYVHRARRGDFTSLDGLLAIRGIGPRVLARLRPYATLTSDAGHEYRLRRW